MLVSVAVGAPGVAQADPSLQTVAQPVVYGSDDRTDVFAHPDEALRRLASESVVALATRRAVLVDGNRVQLVARSLQETMGLCSGERFAEQPSAAFCSGTLIAPDLILTAGHCIQPTESSCANTVFVFGYSYAQQGQLGTSTIEDVYSCQRVVAHALNEGASGKADYAIVQLDRPATPRYTPANVASQFPSLAAGSGVVMIGSPSGIPAKIDAGGRVRDPRSQVRDYFVATTDSFGGNSGSGVFDASTLELVGILVEGDTDYVESGGCNRVRTCTETGCQGENVLYARPAIDAYCRTGTDAVLCNSTSRCGDGYCAFDETAATCSQDCQAPVCGDGRCTGDEWSTCPQDCELTIPSSWTCVDSYYGTNDGCDCECGAWDPDCDANASSFSCGFFGTCVQPGTCEGGFGDGPLCTAVVQSPTGQGKQPAPWALVWGIGGALLMRRRVARIAPQ